MQGPPIFKPMRIPRSVTLVSGGCGMSVSNWEPDIDVLMCSVFSKRPVRLLVQTNISFTKIGEGNYNKAYCLEMEDRRKVIAKVPHPNAGPRVITTSSEVATMDFARTILKIPVP